MANEIDYPREKVEAILITLAKNNGNCSQTSRELADTDFSISQSALYGWKTSHKVYAPLYQELQLKVLPLIRQKAAEHHMAIAEQATAVNESLIAKIKETYQNIAPRDLPGASRNLATVTGIHTDKARHLRGESDQVPPESQRDFMQVMRAIKSKLGEPQEPRHVEPRHVEAIVEAEVVDG
jgi:hypothetical protein